MQKQIKKAKGKIPVPQSKLRSKIKDVAESWKHIKLANNQILENKRLMNFIGELERIPRDTRNLISLVKKKTKLKTDLFKKF